MCIYIYIYTSVAYVAIRRQKYSGPGVLWELAAVLDVLKEYVAIGSRFGSPQGGLEAVLEARNGSSEAQAGSTEAQEGSTEAQAGPAGQGGRPRRQSKGKKGLLNSGPP